MGLHAHQSEVGERFCSTKLLLGGSAAAGQSTTSAWWPPALLTCARVHDSSAASCQVQTRPGICRQTGGRQQQRASWSTHLAAEHAVLLLWGDCAATSCCRCPAMNTHCDTHCKSTCLSCCMWGCAVPVRLRLFSWYSSLVGRSGAGRPWLAAAAMAAARSAPPKLPAVQKTAVVGRTSGFCTANLEF